VTGYGVRSLFYTELPGNPTIYRIIIILFISFLRTLLLPPFIFVWMKEGAYGVSEGDDNARGRLGFDSPPLNLVLYMYLRIFTYTSNVLITSKVSYRSVSGLTGTGSSR
jgi:hypothetical protein